MIEQPLRGWKEIATFLGTSPRNAQRWERELALPIHRLRKATGSVVSAFPSELDQWRRNLATDVAADTEPGRDAAEREISEAAKAVPLRRLTRPAWVLAIAMLAITAAAAAIWLRARVEVSRLPPAASTRQSTVRQSGVVMLKCSQDSRTATVLVQEGQFATLGLPGTPTLQIRATRVASRVQIEVYAPATPDWSRGPVRVADILLAPREPATLAVAGSRPLSIAWEP